MRAMLLDKPNAPLRLAHVPIPVPSENEVLIRIKACGVCRTDLHIADGELPPRASPLIMGHEVVGEVVQRGALVTRFSIGDRIGVPWLGGSCRHCEFCQAHRENLCDRAVFTGYDRDGGYAEYAVADARYCFLLPARYDELHAAPLLCAGLIGYRAYAMTDNARRLGLYGFGAAAHIIAQVAQQQGKDIYAFTRPGDVRSQEFARSLGAAWAGNSDVPPPVPLDAAIIFAPLGALVPQALAATRKGATVVCAGIHMSDIPRFPYSLLWGERTLRSVANLTRADGEAFFAVAGKIDIRTSPVPFPLERANDALSALRAGEFDGAAVLLPDMKGGQT
ncbi:MAG TPA: zinc-dependent alcohol dehydrogenase family protein [Noviherbaspirillum sp.]